VASKAPEKDHFETGSFARHQVKPIINQTTALRKQ